MIQRPEGGDMTSSVMAWVETDTGRLIRAQVKTRDARIGVLPFDALVPQVPNRRESTAAVA